MIPIKLKTMTEKKYSKLAICSIILSTSSIFLWLSWIAGVICGHMARARIKANKNLEGNNLALIGLVIGYFFPAVLLGIVLYLGGYLERQVTVIDHGRQVWEGCFPHDANNKDLINRSDSVLIPVKLNGKTIGTIESRDQNLRLVLKRDANKQELTIWRYHDYGAVSKITVDEDKNSLVLYYDYTLIRTKDYNTVVSLTNFSVHNYLINRGKWCL